MASFSGFIRKAPSPRLKVWFETHGLEIPEDFNWQSEERSTAFVTSIKSLFEAMPALKQDALKAELDYLTSLATDKGMMAADEICPASDIDLEGLEGVEDVILMLASEYPDVRERVGVLASFRQRYGGRTWSAF